MTPFPSPMFQVESADGFQSLFLWMTVVVADRILLSYLVGLGFQSLFLWMTVVDTATSRSRSRFRCWFQSLFLWMTVVDY